MTHIDRPKNGRNYEDKLWHISAMQLANNFDPNTTVAVVSPRFWKRSSDVNRVEQNGCHARAR